MLFQYLQDVRRLLRDPTVMRLNEDDLIIYVNRARREVALRSQCIRVTPPISGEITTLTVVAGGSGYTAPTLTISAPDAPSSKYLYPAGRQATGTAQEIGGVISNASIILGGEGYFQPTVTITDPHGSGAVVTAQTIPLSVLNPQQEEYRFADFPLQSLPGVKAVIGILSVSSLFNNLRYTWIYKPWTEYQAFIRTYTQQYFYTPAVWSQYGQGAAGTFFCYPIPGQTYQFEPDCICSPIDLGSDEDVEAIPEPWTDAVAYGAAALAYQELQIEDKATYLWKQFREYINAYGMMARPGRVPVIYARRY